MSLLSSLSLPHSSSLVARRTSEEQTKRWATLALVNQLFKIYFKASADQYWKWLYVMCVSLQINKLPLCKPLIRAIDSSSLKDRFSLAQTVTYKFFVGRKAMFDSEFKTGEPSSLQQTLPASSLSAASYLQFAFANCYPTSKKNKR